LASDRLNPAADLRPVFDTIDRRAIDIIVPVYKSVHLTTRCLNSLAEHIQEIADSDPRLIVINDSPGEQDVHRMLEVFASRHSYVMLIENEINLGFVKSVNKGLEIACKAGRDVILVNADTETFAETLKNLVDAVYSDPQIAFASPRSNNASFCSLPHIHGGAVATQAESYRRWKTLSRTMPPFHFVPTAVGFYLYIKNEVIANFGYLDPEFGLGYEEENDLILRANKAGYRAVLVNNAFAFHAGSASFTLLDMNLRAHQGANLQKMAQRHTEYLPLIRRYEASAHFRAERLLSQGLPSVSGRVKLVFDLSTVGAHFNGTNEMSIAIVNGFYERHSDVFDIHVICSQDAFKFHKLNRHENLQQHDSDRGTSERFAIGILLGQPFTVHAISVLENLAPINIFGMLDTIAEDCGHLSIVQELGALWGHAARHASGLFFNSRFSERTFITRYPDAKFLARYARLLPTKLSSYEKPNSNAPTEHVLIMGNHFAHKASDLTAELLGPAFPSRQFVVLGKQNSVVGNLRTYRSGTLDEKQMDSLYTQASIVVLPSHVEGFGFGLVHALAAGKVVVARDIPATREILSSYNRFSGVFLYRNDDDLARVMRLAMNESASYVDDNGAVGWNEWVDGFAGFSLSQIGDEKIFNRVVNRIHAGDQLRKAELYDRMQSLSAVNPADVRDSADRATLDATKRAITDSKGRQWSPARKLKELLDLDNEEFVYSSYVTIFNRLPDSDGLLNYLTELRAGVSKVEIITRLRRSSEGRQRRSVLAGYRSIAVKMYLRSLLDFSSP
jgi:GT2 family glycosyltransferase